MNRMKLDIKINKAFQPQFTVGTTANSDFAKQILRLLCLQTNEGMQLSKAFVVFKFLSLLNAPLWGFETIFT